MGGSKLRCPPAASNIIGLSGAGWVTNADIGVMSGTHRCFNSLAAR
jgi:hypothetical protein